MTDDWISALGMVLSATCVVLACLSFLAAWQSRLSAARPSLFASGGPATAFLFDGERLLDMTPDARSLLSDGDDNGAWPRVLARLGPMFPGLGQLLENLPRTGQMTIASGPDILPPVLLRAEHLTGLTRLTMIDSARDQTSGQRDCATLAALQHEVLSQRAVLTHSPTPIWRESQDGEVIWANHAYMIRAVELLSDNEELSWPLPRLFDAPNGSAGGRHRAQLVMQGGTEWFDLIRVPQGAETLCYAEAANAAVKAEASLREFMQTLTKTFADLPTGLAIFDRTRVLQLFNPALADLTGLPPEFLISRPTLSAVLDAMRAKAMLPEPKNYRGWRKHLIKLEEEASMGLFEETWSLPGGRTYRVVGRPHPNGALAFIFEDISTEMTRTRRYRADLELGQSVIDAVDEAVAVFSQGGQLVMSNLAYAQLWNHDPAVLLSDAGISSLCAWWRDHSAPSLLWDDASEFVSALADRTAWDGEARLLDGRQIVCRFRPLAAGATLITFRAQTAEARPAFREPDMSHLLSA
jgi:PAS domain-containing protein